MKARKLGYRESSDDEEFEVKLNSHRKGADEPDPHGADIRNMPEASDTQWDEWLLKTEPLQAARPRWNKDGRPQWYLTRRGSLTQMPLGVWSAGMWNSEVLRPLCCHLNSGLCKRRR